MVRQSVITTSPKWIERSTADCLPVVVCLKVGSPELPKVAELSRSHSSISAPSSDSITSGAESQVVEWALKSPPIMWLEPVLIQADRVYSAEKPCRFLGLEETGGL